MGPEKRCLIVKIIFSLTNDNEVTFSGHMGTYVARFLKQYPLIAYTLRFRVRLWARPYKPFLNLLHTHTHTHTHIPIQMHTHMHTQAHSNARSHGHTEAVSVSLSCVD